jgi:hypothetical protein
MPKTLSDIRELQGVGEVEAAPPEDKPAPRRQRRPRPPATPEEPVAEAGDPAPAQPQSSDRPAAAAQTADEEAGADADFVEPGFAPSDADASWPEAGLVSAAPVVPAIASAGERAIADARGWGRRRSRIADGVALALLLSALGLGSSR